jgi:hypothetical protein
MITRRAVATITIAIAVTSSYSPATSARQQSTGRKAEVETRSASIASQLCGGFRAGGEFVALGGSRLQWSQPGAPGDSWARAAEFIRLVEQQPNVRMAANGSWTAAFDTETRVLARHNCTTRYRDAVYSNYQLDQIVISESGDVAEHADTGVTLVHQIRGANPEQAAKLAGLESGIVVHETKGTTATDLLWIGRRLVLANPQSLSTVDANGSKYSLASGSDVPRQFDRALHFNGLTYLLREDGCFDVYAGPSLTPRVGRVACAGPAAAAARYVGADADTLRLLDARGNTIWTEPRPSVASIRVARGRRAASEVFSILAKAPWTRSVPVDAVALDSADEWTMFLRDWTTSNTQAAELGRIFAAKGWGGFRLQKDGFSTGRGIAYSVQPGIELISPLGRTLSQLGVELRGWPYTSVEAERIVRSNSELNDSLEGYLFKADWTPIGAMPGPARTRALAFVARGSAGSNVRKLATPAVRVAQVFKKGDDTSRDLELADQCAESMVAADDELRLALRQGVTALGLVDSALRDALSLPERIEISSNTVVETQCAGGPRYVIVRNARLRGIRNNTIVRLAKPEVMGAGDLRYRAADNAAWPVLIDGDIVIGVDASTPDGFRGSSVSDWLDRLLAQNAAFPPIALPVTTLQLMVVVEPDRYQSRVSEAKFAGATIFSAETRPAMPRQNGPCIPSEAELRTMHEEWMRLARVNGPGRAARNVTIGVAENAVRQLRPIFARADGETLWLTVDEHGFIVRLTEARDDPRQRDAKDVSHGTRVAGILAAQSQLKGILSDTNLMWIDLTVEPDMNQLTSLANKLAVVNVSQRFTSNSWITLETQAPRLHKKLLFVAAVANDTEDSHGSPVEWKSLPNIIGVGLIRGDRTLPRQKPGRAEYLSDYVDLVAPGASVPTIDYDAADATTIACVSGTSYATAYVSAVATLVAQRAGGRTSPAQLKARLLATAIADDAYVGKVRGGLVDAWRAADSVDTNVVVIEAGTTDDDNVEITSGLGAIGVLSHHSGTISSWSSAPPYTSPIPWERILRFQRMSARDALPRLYRISFIDSGGRYTVIENARIAPNQKIPLIECESRNPAEPVDTCGETNVDLVRDFIAKMPDVDVNAF